MADLWILVFAARGLLAAAGDVMPLQECEWRGRDMGPSISHVVCINTKDPSCRIYREPFLQSQKDMEKRCRRRIRSEKVLPSFKDLLPGLNLGLDLDLGSLNR